MSDNYDGVKFTAVDDEGREIECYSLFTFESPETGRNYLVYTDYSTDENGDTKVFASVIVPSGDGAAENEESLTLELAPIETDEEWELVAGILEELQADYIEPDKA